MSLNLSQVKFYMHKQNAPFGGQSGCGHLELTLASGSCCRRSALLARAVRAAGTSAAGTILIVPFYMYQTCIQNFSFSFLPDFKVGSVVIRCWFFAVIFP